MGGGGKPWDARLATLLVRPLCGTRVVPNHLTGLRLLFGMLACAGLSEGGFLFTNLGALCFVISNFLDHTDGELARLTGTSSRFGHLFDLASDAAVNILLFVGIGVGLRNTSLGGWAIAAGFAAGIAVAGIFHMRHQIEQAVGKPDARQPHAGGFEAEDVLYALPLVSLAGQLQVFLLLAAVGAPLFGLWVLGDYLRRRGSVLT